MPRTASPTEPLSTRVLHTEACPKCGSPDNVKRYDDGHAKCWSGGCDFFEPPGTSSLRHHGAGAGHTASHQAGDLVSPTDTDFAKGIASRCLEPKTLRRFGYFPRRKGGKAYHICGYYDRDGELAFQKYRDVEAKEFFVVKAKTVPRPAEVRPFGYGVWPLTGKGALKRCYLLEGEIDAQSAAQATSFDVPCYSPPLGAGSAKAHVAANLDLYLAYEEIVILFDADEAGRKAAAEVAEILPPEKVLLASYPQGYKDANDLLKAKKPGTLRLAMESATRWSPPGTITGYTLLDLIQADADAPPPVIITFPFAELQKNTAGAFRRGDTILLIAGSGTGKTTFTTECIAHWLDEGLRVGTIMFEDQPIDILNGVLTVPFGRRLRLNSKLATAAEKRRVMEERGWIDRLFIEDTTITAKTKDGLFNKIRYLVGARGCDVILIDPLSKLVSRAITDADERRAIDSLMDEVSDLGRALNVTIVMTHHLRRPGGDVGHEEGARVSLSHARGSHGIAMFSASCLALEAPERGLDEGLKRTKVTVLKSRWRGELLNKTVSYLRYLPDTGRLIELPPHMDGNADIEDKPNDEGTTDSAGP